MLRTWAQDSWLTRRGAADLLRALAASHREATAVVGGRAQAALQLLRADKQKVVREAALAALTAALALTVTG